MAEQLHLYVCEHFKAETNAVLALGNYSDVDVSYFPARCNRPMPASKQLESLSLFDKNNCKDKLLCSCSCLSLPDKQFLDKQNITAIYLPNCFQMFISEEFINQQIKEGAYLITPDWLTKWKTWVKFWGNQEQAQQILAESITKLVLLDTLVIKDCITNLKDFSTYVKQPFEVIPIGLKSYQLFIENEIFKWRLQHKNEKITPIHITTEVVESDYAMALDLISSLTRFEKENEVAKGIMDIFVMMFAAKKVNYLSLANPNSPQLHTFPSGIENDETKQRLLNCNQPLRVTKSGNGFCMKIGKDNNVLAIVEIDELSFPENLTKYQNLALAMLDVFVLAIENAQYLEELHDVNENLKGLNTTKDKLFSIIAHDLRSPFNIILGLSDLLIENIYEMDIGKCKQFSESINSSAQNTLNLLDNLLQWAKSQTKQIVIHPKRIYLSSLLREVIDSSRLGASLKNISIILDQVDDIELLSDENMLKIVLQNLISNSIKFSKPEGKILISTTTTHYWIQITITDYGVGMSEETLKKLFDIKTNITKPGTNNEKGSGLGLVLCKEFVELLEGKIWAESELNKGSSFKFRLPRKK